MPGHFEGAEAAEMRRGLLAIDKMKTQSVELSGQGHESHFGGVGDPMEHRLAEKGLADGHAVRPTDKIPVLPSFHAMGVTGRMMARWRTRCTPSVCTTSVLASWGKVSI